jgi:hypothetical protein
LARHWLLTAFMWRWVALIVAEAAVLAAALEVAA